MEQALLDKALPIIEFLVLTKSRKNKFSYFTEEDISQEIRIICLRALEEYEESKGELQNYLQVCVTNRLRNLRRDRYFRPAPESQQHLVRTRISIVNAGSFTAAQNHNAHRDSIREVFPAVDLITEPSDRAINAERMQQIAAVIPSGLLDDFELLLSGAKIPRTSFTQIQRTVLEFIETEKCDADNND